MSTSYGRQHKTQAVTAGNCGAVPVVQVFQTLIDGFGEAYQPLLTEIQQAFDASIQQGLQDALENCTLRQQLLAAGRQQAAAEDAVKAEVIAGQHKDLAPDKTPWSRCVCRAATPGAAASRVGKHVDARAGVQQAFLSSMHACAAYSAGFSFSSQHAQHSLYSTPFNCLQAGSSSGSSSTMT